EVSSSLSLNDVELVYLQASPLPAAPTSVHAPVVQSASVPCLNCNLNSAVFIARLLPAIKICTRKRNSLPKPGALYDVGNIGIAVFSGIFKIDHGSITLNTLVSSYQR